MIIFEYQGVFNWAVVLLVFLITVSGFTTTIYHLRKIQKAGQLNRSNDDREDVLKWILFLSVIIVILIGVFATWYYMIDYRQYIFSSTLFSLAIILTIGFTATRYYLKSIRKGIRIRTNNSRDNKQRRLSEDISGSREKDIKDIFAGRQRNQSEVVYFPTKKSKYEGQTHWSDVSESSIEESPKDILHCIKTSESSRMLFEDFYQMYLSTEYNIKWYDENELWNREFQPGFVILNPKERFGEITQKFVNTANSTLMIVILYPDGEKRPGTICKEGSIKSQTAIVYKGISCLDCDTNKAAVFELQQFLQQINSA